MTTDPDVDRCLGHLRQTSRVFADELRGLPPDAWDAETNCSPWRVRDLAAHVVASGEGFAASIGRGLAGSVEPPPSEARERRQAELAGSPPEAVARALDDITDAFERRYDGLDEAGLAAIGWHRRGNRPVRWFAAHRLAEVAFHRWDLLRSLGREAQLGDDVALALLPTLLESNAPRTYAAGLSAARGSGERFLLVADGDPSARWLVAIHPDRLDATRGDGPADVTIAGRPSALALLVYGRDALDDAERAGRLHVEGDRAVAERFAAIFPRP